jgi:hypothetical protein
MRLVIKGKKGSRRDILLTNEKNNKPYGMPVAVINGKDYGPGDDIPNDLYLEHSEIDDWLFKEAKLGNEILSLAVKQRVADDYLVMKFTGGIDRFAKGSSLSTPHKGTVKMGIVHHKKRRLSPSPVIKGIK